MSSSKYLKAVKQLLRFLQDCAYSQLYHLAKFYKLCNLRNPLTYNEKLQSMKANYHISELLNLVYKIEVSREPHYRGLHARVIAEPLLEDETYGRLFDYFDAVFSPLDLRQPYPTSDTSPEKPERYDEKLGRATGAERSVQETPR